MRATAFDRAGELKLKLTFVQMKTLKQNRENLSLGANPIIRNATRKGSIKAALGVKSMI